MALNFSLRLCGSRAEVPHVGGPLRETKSLLSIINPKP